MKFLGLFLLICGHLCLFADFADVIHEKELNPPVSFSCEEATPKHNNILYGAIPTTGADKPILVFIHGFMDNGYGSFMLNNNMYESAYNEGYRTTYLFHPQNRGVVGNGELIRKMLDKVVAHYGEADLVLIPHSKGGIDTEFAMYKYGADSLVKAVISMSTPYHGVPIADLYNNPLIEIIGNNIPYIGDILRKDGTKHLQSAYINGIVRPYMDNHPDNKPWKHFSLGGWGAIHKPVIANNVSLDLTSILFYALPFCYDLPVGDLLSSIIQLFFSASGAITNVMPNDINNPNKHLNDGLVPYYGSTRPGGLQVLPPPPSSISYLNHFDFLYGQSVWPFISDVLTDLDNLLVQQMNQKSPLVQRLSKPSNVKSDLQIITDSKEGFYLRDNQAQLFVMDNSGSGFVEIKNKHNEVVLTQPIRDDIYMPFSAFKAVNLTSLKKDEFYHITTDKKNFIAWLSNNQSSTIEVQNITTKMNSISDMSITTKDINGRHIQPDELAVYLKRNLDIDGNAVSDEVILLEHTYKEGAYHLDNFSNELLFNGVYNMTVTANLEDGKQFLTTSFVLENIKKKQSLFELEIDIIVYPNPFSNEINITSPYSGNSIISIYSLEGRLALPSIEVNLFENESMQLSNYCDLESIQQGFYMLSVETPNGLINRPIMKL